MNNYNFSTLNDKDFETLAKDLLNAKFHLELQNFKVGRDKGVDLRYSTPKKNNSIVVQVKHYIGSKYSNLKSSLKTKELGKVKKLNPDRYIVVTSLPLSNTQKDDIKILMKPFIKTSNDIIGQEDLNSYLSEFKEIEKRHFKLWFSSINILDLIINNAISGRTQYLLKKISKNIPFYVITKKLDEANRILSKEKLLLITGQPGIGKTTLAEMILFERAKNEYKIHQVENIREAEDVISTDDEEKQLFYFDDFLGANYVEILNTSKTESQITSFVERIRNTPNKYLVLTTRTIILNHAIKQFEKINRSKLANEQFEIELTDYSKFEKALILYNHLYFNGVKEELYNSILHKKFYKDIIEHDNYTPRIIEFITDKSRINNFSSSNYRQFIQNNLNNPEEIWRHSFNNQVGYFERCLLLTLFTFENSVSEKRLLIAFENRLKFEKEEHNQVIDSNQFSSSIKILLNGFVSSSLTDIQNDEREYSFINPSLADFLIHFVSESPSETKCIISSIVYFEQLNRFDSRKSPISLEKDVQIIIRDKFANSEIIFLEEWNRHWNLNKRYSTVLKTLVKYCKEVNTDSLLLKTLKKMNFQERIWSGVEELEYVLLHLKNAPQTYSFIKDNFIRIIELVIDEISSESSAEKIPALFDKYEKNFKEYQETTNGNSKLSDLIGRVAKDMEEDFKSMKEDEIDEIDEVIDFYDEIQSTEFNLCVKLLPTLHKYYSNIEMDKYEWEEKIKENFLGNPKNELSSSDYEEHYREIEFENHTEDKEIDDLFYKQE